MFSIQLEHSIQSHSKSTDESNDLSSKGTGLVGEIVAILAVNTVTFTGIEVSTIAVSSERYTFCTALIIDITTFANVTM